jgi:hypothetical protein
MGTRARIAIATPTGYRSIYTHWDGGPEHHGRILLEHYTDPDKIRELIALGDLSSLRGEIGAKHPFDPPSYDERDAWNEAYGKMCNAYGRDRGEKNVDTAEHKSFASLARTARNCDAEWLYVWLDEKWLFAPVRKSMTFGRMAVLTTDAIAQTA